MPWMWKTRRQTNKNKPTIFSIISSICVLWLGLFFMLFFLNHKNAYKTDTSKICVWEQARKKTYIYVCVKNEIRFSVEWNRKSIKSKIYSIEIVAAADAVAVVLSLFPISFCFRYHVLSAKNIQMWETRALYSVHRTYFCAMRIHKEPRPRPLKFKPHQTFLGYALFSVYL